MEMMSSSVRSSAIGGILIGLSLGILLERFRLKTKQQKLDDDDCHNNNGTSIKNRKTKGVSEATTGSSTEVVKSGKVIHVDREQLEKSIAACLEKAGAASSHASLVANVLVAADCRGIPSHGVNRAELYCAELAEGLVDGQATPKITTSTDSIANVDGCNGLGAVVSKFAMELCIQKAKALDGGISIVVCHHSNHYGIAGYWADLALKAGLIGFSFTNTSLFMVPTRSCVRAGGTNPIACYCPASKNDSFQLDMASTTVPIGKVEVCHRKNQELPMGWGVASNGTTSTTDPTEVMMSGGLTPLGGMEMTAGYKGYGINMMIEILCGVLSGCKDVGPDIQKWNINRSEPLDYGHCFICIDPKRFVAGEDGAFEKKLSAYLKRMRELPSAQESLPVLVPGDPEKSEEELALSKGVCLNQNIALGVRDLARRFNCTELLPTKILELPESAHAAKHLFASKQ